jgi:hypothetical protein
LADAVTEATDSIAAQGVAGAFALLFIGAIVALWRRDQARNAAELERIDTAHAREVERLEQAATRETSRADTEAKARADLEREVRSETTRIMQTTADRLEETALALRDVRRQP